MTQAESRVLHALMDRYVAGRAVSMVDISRATGYSIGTAYATVRDLHKRGLLVVRKDGKRYVLHPGEVT